MSNSGGFDQLANALVASGPSPSATLRHARATRQKAYAARGLPAPAALEPVVVVPQTVPPKPPRSIDRSRDHAIYAAPHRPNRAHFHSRPDDIPTERALPRFVEAPEARAPERARKKPLALALFAAAIVLSSAGAALFYVLH